MKGYTLALDLPASRPVRTLISQLQQLTLKAGGRIYLAKDATLDAGTFAAMYQNSARFKSFLKQIDPQRRMSSAMSRRLGLHAGSV